MRSADPVPLADRAAADFRDHRAGDEAALGRLIESTSPLLWHTARGLGLDAAAAEDVVQDTWVALYRAADGIDSPQAVLQWLLTTARRRAWATGRLLARAPVLPPDHDEDDRPSPEPGPEAYALGRESDRVLWAQVSRLSQRCQYLLRVVAMGEPPDYTAIAAALGMPVGSIGPTRGRCLARLRAALGADWRWTGAA